MSTIGGLAPTGREPERSIPTGRTARALGPDVARGFMLLFIILANTTLYLSGFPDGALGRPVDTSGADSILDAIGALFIDNRSFTMFAFLFAYGIHQLTVREQERGSSWPHTRGLLLRRNAWLFAIGAVHAIFLFFGDIISTYAIAGLALLLLVRAPRWVLWLVFGLSLTVFIPMAGVDTLAASGFSPPLDGAPPSVTSATFAAGYPMQLITGASVLIGAPFAALGMLAPMVLGLLLARERVLETPWERPRLVRWIAIGGIAIGVIGGLPLAWAFLTGAEASPLYLVWGVVHGLSGLAAGPAYACAIALMVSPFERRRLADPSLRPSAPLRALSALGRRSLSAYVAQSVFCIVLFPTWAFGLGGMLGTGPAALVAIGIWFATLIGAVILDYFDTPGPLEWLLRRLTYGRRARRDAGGRGDTSIRNRPAGGGRPPAPGGQTQEPVTDT